MSKSSVLKESNIKRLKDFLNTGSVTKSANNFKIGVPSFRECLINTTQSLVYEMNNGKRAFTFTGNIKHTKDIYANKELIIGLIEILKSNIKVSKEKTIGQMTESEFKLLLSESLDEYFRRK